MVVSKGKKAAPKAATNKGKVQKTITKQTSNAGVVDASFEVDEEARYTGECVYFNRQSGFGFVKLDDAGVVPEDKVMIYWKEIKSDDRWPALYKGFKCQLGLKKTRKGKDWTVQGKEITGADGEEVAIQEENEDKKEYVGDKNMRFLGNVKFYDFKKAFGYVKLQEGYAVDDEVPTELRVQRQEINAGHDAPTLKNDMEIEFGIMKNKKGQYSCYNVTLPGGEPITRAIAEGRHVFGTTKYTGEVQFWSGMDGFGWISPADMSKLPKEFQKAAEADLVKRKAKAEKKGKDIPTTASLFFRRGDRANFDQKLRRGAKVKFLCYKDTQGVGACEVEVQ